MLLCCFLLEPLCGIAQQLAQLPDLLELLFFVTLARLTDLHLNTGSASSND